MATDQHFTVLGISGSLRKLSFNSALVRQSATHAPQNLSVTHYEPGVGLPLFDQDLESAGVPDAVSRLVAAVQTHDAVLFATPEYNQSIPGTLKNAIDWISRTASNPLRGKAVGIVGATVGPWGTRYAQAALRHTLTSGGALVMPAPQFFLRNAAAAFQDGIVTDSSIAHGLTEFMSHFAKWIAFCRRDS